MFVMVGRGDWRDVNPHHGKSWLFDRHKSAITRDGGMRGMNMAMPAQHLVAALQSYVGSLRNPMMIGLLLALLGLQGCVGSPLGIESRPDFVLQTPYGPVAVSMRQPLPGMTAGESAALVRSGMQEALPGMQFTAPADGRDLPLRLVWHVNLQPPSGGSAMVVLNVFDGAQPVWYDESSIAGDCTPRGLSATVARMTRHAAGVALSMAFGGFTPAAGAVAVPPNGRAQG